MYVCVAVVLYVNVSTLLLLLNSMVFYFFTTVLDELKLHVNLLHFFL